MTTANRDEFLAYKKFKTLVNSKGQIIGERVRGVIHVYLGTKRPCHK
jgi:hypothetical protein